MDFLRLATALTARAASAAAAGRARRSWTAAALVRMGLLVVLTGAGQAAWAFSAGLDAFRSTYPGASALHTCGVCHNSAAQPFPLLGSPQRSTNGYGKAWRQALEANGAPAPPGQTLAQGMQALSDIEALDSDADGFSNAQEISTATGFFPGNAASRPPLAGDTVAPTSPVLALPGDIGAEHVALSWSPSSDNVGVTSYRVHRLDQASASYVQIASLAGNVTRYSDVGLEPATRHFYYVTALDAAGNSARSQTVSADTTAGPTALAVAFVPNHAAATVSVVDIENRTVAATVAVGGGPWGVAVAPDGLRAYVSNSGSNSVSVIDTLSHQVIATIPVGLSPRGIAVTRDGSRIYVSNFDDNTVSVIAAASQVVIRTVAVGSAPYGVAVNPASNRVYVANSGSATVSVIDDASTSVQTTVAAGPTPWAVALSPDGTRLYVTNYLPGAAGSARVIDTASNRQLATIAGLSSPGAVVVGPDGRLVYVTSFDEGTVSAVDTATLLKTGTTFTGPNAGAVALDPVSGHVLVANFGNDTLAEVALPVGGFQAARTVADTGASPLGLGPFVGLVPSVGSLRNAERLFDWNEVAYAHLYQPAGARSQVLGSYFYRYYPQTQSYVGVRGGRVYYLGPASNYQILDVGTFAFWFEQAQAAGY